MFHVILVAIAAHLMRGKGSRQQMVGVTVLYTLSHLLGIVPPLLGLIPVAGRPLQVFTGMVARAGSSP